MLVSSPVLITTSKWGISLSLCQGVKKLKFRTGQTWKRYSWGQIKIDLSFRENLCCTNFRRTNSFPTNLFRTKSFHTSELWLQPAFSSPRTSDSNYRKVKVVTWCVCEHVICKQGSPSEDVHRVKSGLYISVSLLITSICSKVSWTASLNWESQGTYAAQNWKQRKQVIITNSQI